MAFTFIWPCWKTLVVLSVAVSIGSAQLPGSWEVVVPNAGIASMHTAVTRFDTVVLLDRTNNGPTRRMLRKGHCRFFRRNRTMQEDCYAHSALLDLSTGLIRPLTILTDTWCSSGQFLPNGSLLQTGGDMDGYRVIRRFDPCATDKFCDWQEVGGVKLSNGRWYATNQILPDGSVIVVGGRGSNTVEFFPPRNGAVAFPFLAEAEDAQMDNLYPYVHLLPNGHLFVFVNNKAVLYDHVANAVVRYYPPLEGGPRNYPSAGSSVMLALEGSRGFSDAVIVVCGGAQYGAFIKKNRGSPALGSCGKITATSNDANWETEEMPFGRIMGDMVVLPTGDVLIINGAKAGTQGFEMASDPYLNPVLYRPDQPLGLRFVTLTPGTVPRMYHSTANLLPDGRVLLAGSNPHHFYDLNSVYPTELRIEGFSPEYLSEDRKTLRPTIVAIPERIRYEEGFIVVVRVPLPVVAIIEVNFASAPFATHSFSQGQRLVKLDVSSAVPQGVGEYRIACTAPPNGAVAPPGYYMAFAVNQGVPSVAKWINLVS